MAYLLDTNILLRFAHRKSSAHATVRAAIRHLRVIGETLHFAPQNAVEAWNVVTRPLDKNGFGFAPQEADQLLQLLERLFVVLPETPAVYTKWRSLVLATQVSGVQVHDARLVAWMQVHGVSHVLTLNSRDFKRYEQVAGIVVIDPKDIPLFKK